MGIYPEPKNKKRSIHLKYKRRLRSLKLALDDFIIHAYEKLDRGKAGNIHHREFIESVVSKAEDLSAMLPSPEEILPYPCKIDVKNLERLFGMVPAEEIDNSEEVSSQSLDLRDFLELGEEELKDMSKWRNN